MQRKKLFRRWAAGLTLAGAVAVATVMIVLSVGSTGPSINFKCLKFNLMDDGSIQAVVTISAENIPHLAGTEFSINYNDKYIQPSNTETNSILPMGETQAFFEQDSQLYPVFDESGKLVSPFLKNPMGSSSGLKLGLLGYSGTEKLLSMALYPDSNIILPEGAGKIERLPAKEGGTVTAQSLPGIMADGTVEDGEGAVIGTISFRVDPEKLTEMVQKFSDGGTITNPAPGEKSYLLGLSKSLQGNDVWVVAEHYYDAEFDNELDSRTYSATVPGDMKVNFLFTFPKVLVKAAPAVNEVTVNAYEAYTNGTIGDVAAVLRKHSPTVRTGYADGTFEDFLLPWGTADATAEYHVYELNNDGTKGAEVTAYDPKGGKYLVQQNFFYEEDDDMGAVVTKKFPLPMEVKLTVEPVKAQAVTGANLNKTYLNVTGSTAEPVPVFFSKLGLPDVATLVVSPVPGTTSLTVPLDVTAWSSYSADMSGVKASDGTTLWPVAGNGQITPDTGEGTYEFTYTLGDTQIEAAYPWLSDVAASYALNASRVIETQTAGFTDPSAYAVTVARTGTDNENAVFTVTKNGTALAAGDVLTLYLPNGQAVASANYDIAYATTTTITTTIDDIADTELRRYLNLGGWFAVGVQESGTTNPNPEIPVYLPPRDNLYLEERAGSPSDGNPGKFDFTGYYAGLFPYSATQQLGDTVVLPVGYAVKTTYDGMDGAPGGNLSVIKATWGAPTSSPEAGLLPGRPARTLDTYGPKLYNDAWFDGYGQVKNTDKQVEVRVEDQAAQTGTLSLSLTCAPGTQGATVSGGQVTGVVYNTKQKGYRTRQEFTLTLKNTGTRDIYGLSLNLPANNHFEIIKAPAAYLAAGTETTFVVTYLYDLRPVNSADTGLTFKDTISITTNETGATAIKSFTAQFRVTNGPVSTVKVVTNSPLTAATPQVPIMGDAGIIVGLAEGVPADGATSGGDKPDVTSGPSDYEENYNYVWVRSEVYDEYEVGEVYYYKNNVKNDANKVPLIPYSYTGAGGEGDKVAYWFFQMPNDDVTVHVDFIEPAFSKLRLSALLPEARVDADTMTARDLRRWDNNKVTANKGNPLTVEESSLDHFLVVLEPNDIQARLTLELRKVLALIPGSNEDIPVSVLIKEGVDLTILNASGSTDGLNGLPNRFTTADFAAPDPGNSTDVVITLTYTPAGGDPVSRVFTITFAKPPEQVTCVLGYGNSPYGMIMNDGVLTNDEKTAAKEDFDKTRAFTPSLMPGKAAGLTNLYTADAWGATDYDKDETALFVYPGESFLDPGIIKVQDSANKPVAGENISRTVTVTLLNTAASPQADRFSGTETVTLDLGTADTAMVESWWKDTDHNDYLIRPGIYEIVYTFIDYDGVTTQSFTRTLIILPRNGDVNADMTVDDVDAKVIENRVADPMGYTASGTDYPDWSVFRYRVCDVNNDGNFNNIDANLVRDKEKIIPYYLPVGYK